MKKIAMLLALCLLATAFPVTGLGEDGPELSIVGMEIPDAEVEEYAAPDGELLPDGDGGEDAVEGFDTSEALYMNAPAGEWLEEPEASPAVQASEAEASQTPHTDPQGPQLIANEIVLGVGEAFELAPKLPQGVAGGIAFASSDPAVATVSEDGVIEAVAAGFAVVTATADSGAYAECFVQVKKAPDKVVFSVGTLKLGKGETAAAPGVVIGSKEGECAGAYTLSSSNGKIVRVNADGTLKALKKGKTTLRVTTYNGRSATCKVTVLSAPGKVTASADKDALGVGEKGQVSFALPRNTAGKVIFSSVNPAVVEVDAATGEMRGIAPGKTRVCARAFNGKKGYVAVTVAPAPQAISFDETTLRLGVGMEVAAQATLDKGAAGEITYTIENKSTATLKNGRLKGVQAGETVLTARTYNGLTAQCAVQVTAAPKSVKLPYKTLDIGVKQKVLLEPDVGGSASSFTYTSSNKKVVSVSADGTIKGVKKGSATITIKTYNKKQFKLKVNVLKAPGSVSLSPASLELGVQEQATLAAKLPKGTAADLSYTSSDPSVAAVDAHTGAVTGISPGQAVVTVTTGNGKKASATVIVYAVPEWISLAENSLALAAGQTQALSVELSPGSRSPLKYASEDKGIATVSSEGVVTGVAPGQTVITVATNVPEVVAQAYVTVLPAPESVKLEPSSMTLNVGDTTQLVPIIPEGSLTDYTYTSSDEAVATVSGEGMVVTLSRGSCKLTVETHNGKKATLKLTVEDPWFPEEVKLLNAPTAMKVGDSVQLLWSTVPEDAAADLVWESSDKTVASVGESGLLTAYSYGYATIRATSRRNPDIALEFTLGVETDNVTLTIPARTTNVAGIAANLQKIDAIRGSSIRQIDLLQKGGVITSADASRRKTIVNNAFKDYAFPWMTLSKQKYWKAANSEGGAKDFKTDRVYYGMPYISGSAHNREYNVAKALSENRYYDSGEGYYILNQKNLLSGRYVGNDCSCFVDAAIWGTNSSHSHDRTADIAVSSAYKTVSSYNSLRTGDLICKGAAHVVMFLYFVDDANTKMMIIENGGIEPGTNTVHCMIMDTKWYTSRGYAVRRLKSLG